MTDVQLQCPKLCVLVGTLASDYSQHVQKDKWMKEEGCMKGRRKGDSKEGRRIAKTERT